MNKSREFGVRSREYRRILIIRLDRIGDVVLSTPVIKAVRDAYPESYIAFMVRPYARDIVRGNPYLNEVIIYDKEADEKGFIGNLKFILKLRAKKFDMAMVLHPTTRTHMIAFLAGIPERIGYDKKMGFLLTKRIPHTKQFGLKHEIDYTLDISRYIGIDAKDSTLYMPVSENSEYKIKNIFNSKNFKDEDILIIINPGASCPSKRWNTENFIKTANALIDKYNAKIIVISGAKERVFGDKVAGGIAKNVLNLSGATTVGDLASVLRRARLIISNDSGPVHIACAVGTPVIDIFGRSDRGLSPVRWGPTGKRDIVLHKDVGCDVCLAHNCKIGFKCLKAITVEEVLTAADKILGE